MSSIIERLECLESAMGDIRSPNRFSAITNRKESKYQGQLKDMRDAIEAIKKEIGMVC